MGKEKERKARYRAYQCAAIILSVVFLVLALCIFSLRYIWSPSPGKVREIQIYCGDQEILLSMVHGCGLIRK